MTKALIAKLSQFARLSSEDRDAIVGLETVHCKTARAHTPLISEGDKPIHVRLVLSGWACRHKDLANGRRQIVAFFLPGDFCDLNVYLLRSMDHTISAVTDVKYLQLSAGMLGKLTEERPRVAQALMWSELVSASIQREWLVSLGQRTAMERVGHLIVELYTRLKSVGLAADCRMAFPVTQSELAEVTGVTPVHLNRTLQELRRQKLIELESRQLTILDLDRLRDLAMFELGYLHLDREGRHLDAND
ncbi:Crp/Fnr family transcriptional regulator [Qipengyuania spongiae]|uniref:Crp/Fnr family transcriptional regulator n=1 Tax=Qipengyuania spongiae TaxID=2909673 RepID=A0ABY5SXW4_9SPHN|nr:Crp/Fnr family transcriptional regulator [Qipengyuania spongiae]UVI39160.1 Crp/Fnr family transcriptional regulator [Qipengyuania spongiae]